MNSTRAAQLTTLAGLLLGLAACSDDTTDASETPASIEPASTQAPDQTPQLPPEITLAPNLWTNFRGDQALTGVADTTVPDAPELLWRLETEGPVVSSPVIDEGTLYVGSDDGKLRAINAQTGEEIWAFQTELMIEAPPLVHDGVVYVGSHDFFFYAVDQQTGKELWRFETQAEVIGGANIAKAADGSDLVIFGSHDAFLYAANAKTGEIAWTFETQDRVNATPAITDDNRIVFGGCDTTLYVIDAATGTEAGSVTLGGECHIAVSVGIAGDTAYFGHHAGAFVAVNFEDSTSVWEYTNPRYGFYSAPAITDNLVVFGGRDRSVHCVDRATGEKKWSFQTRRKVDAAPVIAGDRVIAASGDGRLYILDLNTGEEIWSADLGRQVFSSPAVVDGTIYVGSHDGAIYAYGSKTSDGTEPEQENESTETLGAKTDG